MEPYIPDLLDELSDHLAKTDPNEAEEWKDTKAVAQASILRRERGVTQAEVAKRMGVPPKRILEIESRPWGATPDLIAAYLHAVGAELGIIVGDLAAPA